MARTLPPALEGLVAGYRWQRDKVGESGATIHRLTAKERPTLYLKQGEGRIARDVVDEFVRLDWLQRQCAVPEVRHFTATGDGAWLLSSAMPGHPAYGWLEANPDRWAGAVTAMARFLRDLHALPASTCPFNAALPLRLAAARANIEAGLVETDDFDDAREGWTAEQVWDRIQALLPLADDPVVTHGDFSLDNIFLADDGSVTGCIDLGRVGVADRYQDLAILAACLEEFDDALVPVLFDAYGIAPDRDRIELHLCLDELF